MTIIISFSNISRVPLSRECQLPIIDRVNDGIDIHFVTRRTINSSLFSYIYIYIYSILYHRRYFLENSFTKHQVRAHLRPFLAAFLPPVHHFLVLLIIRASFIRRIETFGAAREMVERRGGKKKEGRGEAFRPVLPVQQPGMPSDLVRKRRPS